VNTELNKDKHKHNWFLTISLIQFYYLVSGFPKLLGNNVADDGSKVGDSIKKQIGYDPKPNPNEGIRLVR
jgi:hypothetical protein